MFYSCDQSSDTVVVNRLASKRSELIGNAAIVRKRRVIHKQWTCVCLRLPLAAITRKRWNASVDLWPALESRHLANGNQMWLHWFDVISLPRPLYCLGAILCYIHIIGFVSIMHAEFVKIW